MLVFVSVNHNELLMLMGKLFFENDNTLRLDVVCILRSL